MKNPKGFIQIPLLIAIIAGVLVLGGGGYFGIKQYKNYQLKKPEREYQKCLDRINENARLLVELKEKFGQINNAEIVSWALENQPLVCSQYNQELIKQHIVKLKSPKTDEHQSDAERIAELEKKLAGARDQELELLKKEISALKKQQTTQSSPQKNLSNPEIIAKVKPAVVYIETGKKSGSGMIIESNGYILTNAHVVEGYNLAIVKLSDKRSFQGSVIGRDEKIDLALLKIDGAGFSTLKFGNSDESSLSQGAEVLSAGYSYGFEDQVSFKNGIISRRLTDEDGIIYLEITAEIQPGNSGGPLIDKFGQAVGITTFIYGKSGDPLKFALPINTAKDLIPELKAGRNVILPKVVIPSSPSLNTLEKARGKILLMNLDSMTQHFSKGTHLEGQNGLIYLTQEYVMLRPNAATGYENERVWVEIIAENAGQQAELLKCSPCRFYVQSFKGNYKYDLIWGFTMEPIKIP